MSDRCVLVLDDFEGVEKGVVNAMMLRNAFRGMFLVNPAIEKKIVFQETLHYWCLQIF